MHSEVRVTSEVASRLCYRFLALNHSQQSNRNTIKLIVYYEQFISYKNNIVAADCTQNKHHNSIKSRPRGGARPIVLDQK